METTLREIVTAVASELRASNDELNQWITCLERNFYKTVQAVRTEKDEVLQQLKDVPLRAQSRIRELCIKRFSAGPIDGDVQEAAMRLLEDVEFRDSVVELTGELPAFHPGVLDLQPDHEGKFKVVVNEEAFVSNMKLANPRESVFSIAMIGDHASGKSFITCKMMQLLTALSVHGDMSKLVKGSEIKDGKLALPRVYPQVQGADNFGVPTTAGLNLFYAPFKLKDFPLSMVELQDYEGENGGAIPVEAKSRMKRLRDAVMLGADQEQSLRREAVKRMFPALAFAFSDVLFVVGSDNLGNARFKDRISTLLTSFMDALKSVRKPHIFFIWNRCPHDQLQTSEVWTERFLTSHDPEGNFRNLFRDFHCISLPDAKVHPEEFRDRFLEMGKFLIDILQKQALENKLPHRVRLGLMRKVASDVNKGDTVPLEEMLHRALSVQTGTASLSHFMQHFDCLYPQGCLDAKTFHDARVATLHAFARAYALRVASIPSNGTNELSYDEELLEELWECMTNFQPCQAMICVKAAPEDVAKRSKNGASPVDKWLQCGRSCGSHEEHGDHQSSERVALHEQFKKEERFLFFFKRVRLISRFGDRQYYRWTQPSSEFQEMPEPPDFDPVCMTLEDAKDYVDTQIREIAKKAHDRWETFVSSGRQYQEADLILPVQESALMLWTELKQIRRIDSELGWSKPSSTNAYCLVCLHSVSGCSILEATEDPDSADEPSESPICLACQKALFIATK